MTTIQEEIKKVNRPAYILAAIILIGVLCIIVGFVNGTSSLWIAGLVITFVFAFYGIPLIFIRNSERRKTFRLGAFILAHENNTIEMLTGCIGSDENTVMEKVRWLLANGYLPGYIINGNSVILSKLVDPNLQEHSAVCPNCGASFTYVGRIGQCPYCGDYYPPNTNKQQTQ